MLVILPMYRVMDTVESIKEILYIDDLTMCEYFDMALQRLGEPSGYAESSLLNLISEINQNLNYSEPYWNSNGLGNQTGHLFYKLFQELYSLVQKHCMAETIRVYRCRVVYFNKGILCVSFEERETNGGDAQLPDTGYRRRD